MPRIYVITGPSAVGKTTVAARLIESRPTLKKIITCTTRPMRPNETDGADYHFLDAATMERLIADGKMFESARVYDRIYGSRMSDVDAILATGSDVLFVIDVQGTRSIKRDHPEAVTIFIDAASTNELVTRMEARDKGATANRAERIAAAEAERAYGAECDHRVVNPQGALAETVRKVGEIMDKQD